MPERQTTDRTTRDRLKLAVTADRIHQLLEDPPAGLTEDTRVGLDAAVLLLEQDVKALERVPS